MSAKYFTNFGFQGYALTDLHCTHMYLGEKSEQEMETIITQVQIFCRQNLFSKFEVTFDRHEQLNGRRVLSADKESFPQEFETLFAAIDSEYTFDPHVTIDNMKINSVSAVVNRYVVIKKEGKDIQVLFEIEFYK